MSASKTCIYSFDLSSAKKFYHDLLGLPIIVEAEGKHIFSRVGTSDFVSIQPNREKRKVRLHIFLRASFILLLKCPIGFFSLPNGYFHTCNKNFFMKPLTDFLT